MTLHSFRWLNTTSLCTSLLCLFNYLFTNLLNAFCGNGTDARSALENRSNRTEFNNREKLYELPGWTLCSLSVYACVYVCIVCRVWVCVLLYRCVCFCFFLYFFVFLVIFFQLFFCIFIVLATKKSGKRQSQPELCQVRTAQWQLGFFCWPQAELSNERVIDTIINKYRETQQTSSTFS